MNKRQLSLALEDREISALLEVLLAATYETGRQIADIPEPLEDTWEAKHLHTKMRALFLLEQQLIGVNHES
tara:strand:+ start:275 stop:487 length:213 start_codon:yes stop_codon:yes gene_type:complete